MSSKKPVRSKRRMLWAKVSWFLLHLKIRLVMPCTFIFSQTRTPINSDDEPPTNPPSPTPSSNVPTLPRKDYNPSPTPTPEHVVVSTQVRSLTASTADQYLPKLEGTAVWRPQAIEPESPLPSPSPPPPLPKTPQPNGMLFVMLPSTLENTSLSLS